MQGRENGPGTLIPYDASGIPLTITYYDEVYYYITNLQGDVVGIADSTGTLVVRYSYDAWGKVLSITGSMADTLGVQNPLRYRGYVYDHETGLYYLQSRYYNPEIGRFINADALVATGQGLLGNNMFAYCNNNPVIFEDASGHALKPCTEIINDGGDGISSLELLILEGLSESLNASPEQLDYSPTSTRSIHQFELTVNIDGLVLTVMGKNACSEIVGEIFDVTSMFMAPCVSVVISALYKCCSTTLNYYYYLSTPELPNGTYTVYAIHNVTSSVHNYDLPTPQRIDYHVITLVYDLKEPSGNFYRYSLRGYVFYTEYTELGG